MNLLREFIESTLVKKYPKPKRSQYWGKAGAGICFICREDNTILLGLRSLSFSAGGEWGIPGGAVSDGWVKTPIENPLDDNDPLFLETAICEVEEECDTFPTGWSTGQIVNTVLYEDAGFKYKTFVSNISLEQKRAWKPEADNETEAFRWFDRHLVFPGIQLYGFPLHFGVEYILDKM